MLAKDIVTDSIPPLKSSDSGNKALEWMNEFHVDHLPLTKGRDFLGLLAEENILDFSEPDMPLGKQNLTLKKTYVKENQHLYEVIKLVAELNLTLVPVVDKNEKYVGVITLLSLVKNWAQMDAIGEPGGILVLELDLHDYSLTEIARLVEENDAHILSSYVHTKEEEKMVEVTLKINKTDLRHIVATFERFNFRIKQSFQAEDMQDILMERYNSLMKYLDV